MHLLPIYNPLQPDCASLDEGKYALSSCLVGCLFVMHKQLFPVQQPHPSTGMSRVKYGLVLITMPSYGVMLMHSIVAAQSSA